MQPHPHPEVAELVKLAPAKRQARFYRLAIWPDLFGGFPLPASTGASASPDACNLDPFPEIDTARRAFTRIVSRKRRRGYIALPVAGA